MADDDQLIEQARVHEHLSVADENDRWRLNAHERAQCNEMVRKEMGARKLELLRKVNAEALIEGTPQGGVISLSTACEHLPALCVGRMVRDSTKVMSCATSMRMFAMPSARLHT